MRFAHGKTVERIFRTDTDRRRFLGLVSELPGRFGLEIHAFVLMDNHYHLLVRSVAGNLSDAIRWLQVSHAARHNFVHRRRGHLYQGRFKSKLILDEGALDRVGRYLHLNPVRIAGLGLSKADQRRARVLGCPDPGKELVARRVSALREYPWNSWRVYAGLETAVPWLSRDRLQGGSGGRTLREQRRALVSYTEEPIRQGVLASPWEELVGGLILGDAAEAARLLNGRKTDPGQQTEARRVARATRPSWEEMVGATERLLGRPWSEITTRYGDWGRNGMFAVATRHLGWRLVELVPHVPGLGYGAAAQGVRLFRAAAAKRPEMDAFAKSLAKHVSTL